MRCGHLCTCIALPQLAQTTCRGWKRFPSSATLLSTVEPLPAPGIARSVWGIRRFPPPHGCIDSSTENDGEDINDQIEELDGCKATKCLHPRPKCVDAFPSFLEMKFHLQNVHCIEFTKGVKRRRSSSKVDTMPARKKRSRQTKDHNPDMKVDMWPQFTYEFVDETMKLCGRHSTGTSTPPLISSQCSSPLNTAMDESIGAMETLVSSVCTDIFDKLDPHLLDE